MQLQIDGREVDLAQHHGSGAEGLCGLEPLVQLLRQGLPALVVLGEAVQGAPVIAPVLHELGGQLHGVPLNAPDTGHHALLHLSQHVLQGVAKLVEQRLDLAEGHETGLVADGGDLVAHHVRHWQTHIAALGGKQAALSHHLCHPGTSTLLSGPAVGIEEEVCLGTAVLEHLEEAHVLVPHGGEAVHRLDLHTKQAVGQLEQALQHVGQGKVGPELLLVDVVASLTQPLSPEGHVPPLHILLKALQLGELADLLQVLAGGADGGGPQLLKQALGPLQRRHLGRHGQLSKVVEAQQLRLLLAQRQHLLDDGRVVNVPAAGAGHVRPVHLLPQGAVLGMCQHWVVAGEV
mmetsp:Transcript_32916/g.72706  ORF Transcript_32916/g.72706 Transcript_32916/m.72706 type:complete len:347 (-) Transcript_32916:991-2031(-)